MKTLKSIMGKPTASVVVIAAIFTFFGAVLQPIVTGFFDLRSQQITIQAAQVAEARQAQQSSTSNLHPPSADGITINNNIFVDTNTPSSPVGEEVKFNSLRLSLWPEYDKPSVLVIYDIVVSTVPSKISIHIPANTGTIYAIVESLDEHSPSFGVNYIIQPDNNWSIVTFTANKPHIHFEYYDTGLTRKGNNRLFSYVWREDYSIDLINLIVQLPKYATGMFTSLNLGNGQQGSDGLIYFTANIVDKPKGFLFSLAITYLNDADKLTIEGVNIP